MISVRARALLLAILVSTGCDDSPAGGPARDGGAGDGALLDITLTDGEGKPVTARVSVRDNTGGGWLAPASSLPRYKGTGEAYFYATGRVTLDVPPGAQLTVTARRGNEHEPGTVETTVAAGATVAVTVPVVRRFDPAREGWYSGDTHIHVHNGNTYNPNVGLSDVQTMMLGEDLKVGNVLVSNVGTDVATTVPDRALFTGAPVEFMPGYIYSVGEEFRSVPQGHVAILGASSLIEPLWNAIEGTASPYQTPLIADVADRARAQDAIVIYAHPLYEGASPTLIPMLGSPELPADAALGVVQALDLLSDSGSETRSLQMWYALLNTSLYGSGRAQRPLAVTAGTDTELDAGMGRMNAGDPIGCDRVYVRAGGELNYAAWLRGIRAGATYVTNGPLLSLKVNGTADIGDTLELPAATTVTVSARADGVVPIERLEVIVNGAMVDQTLATTPGQTSLAYDGTVTIPSSSWIVINVTEPQGGETSALCDTRIVAITSPVYVTINRTGITNQAAAGTLTAWMQTLMMGMSTSASVEWPSETERQRALARMSAALQFYSSQR